MALFSNKKFLFASAGTPPAGTPPKDVLAELAKIGTINTETLKFRVQENTDRAQDVAGDTEALLRALPSIEFWAERLIDGRKFADEKRFVNFEETSGKLRTINKYTSDGVSKDQINLEHYKISIDQVISYDLASKLGIQNGYNDFRELIKNAETIEDVDKIADNYIHDALETKQKSTTPLTKDDLVGLSSPHQKYLASMTKLLGPGASKMTNEDFDKAITSFQKELEKYKEEYNKAIEKNDKSPQLEAFNKTLDSIIQNKVLMAILLIGFMFLLGPIGGIALLGGAVAAAKIIPPLIDALWKGHNKSKIENKLVENQEPIEKAIDLLKNMQACNLGIPGTHGSIAEATKKPDARGLLGGVEETKKPDARDLLGGVTPPTGGATKEKKPPIRTSRKG